MVTFVRRRRAGTGEDRPSVLIIVQNLPVPLDRRVWLECEALTAAGYQVSVVCPKGAGEPKFDVLDGVTLYKYRPYRAARGKADLVAEDAYSLVMTAWLVAKAWRRQPFQVMQTCNPRDVFWPIGLVFRIMSGGTFVFDQHDLCPELFESRYPDGARWLYRAVSFLEACTFRVASHVISTNNSYRAIAIERGRKRPEDVTVVRSGPDASRLRRGPPEPALKRGRKFLAAYLGVMGPQDGVDVAVRAAAVIVHDLGRTDISFTFMGAGDCLADLIALRDELGLQDYVEFSGRVPDEFVFAVLSTADLGLSPDPKNPLNDLSTMNKTIEYMAFELPVVAFELRETRVSAGGAALYVEPSDPDLFAKAIVELLDDEPGRRAMGALGRERVENELAWHHQRSRYVEVYDRIVGRQPQVALSL